MESIVGIFALGLLAAIAVFWTWMIVDCATKEADTGNTKIVWILIILLGSFIGAGIYYCVRKPQREWEENERMRRGLRPV
jgi:hypothetical protein